jgi:hypothetical protein
MSICPPPLLYRLARKARKAGNRDTLTAETRSCATCVSLLSTPFGVGYFASRGRGFESHQLHHQPFPVAWWLPAAGDACQEQQRPATP